MLYADKENLKTEVAVELLRVREKEMTFYANNLSMVGTQSAHVRHMVDTWSAHVRHAVGTWSARGSSV